MIRQVSSIKQKYSVVIAVLVFGLLSFVLWNALAPQKAGAESLNPPVWGAAPLDPHPDVFGGIPTDNLNRLNSDCEKTSPRQSPGFSQWVSAQGSASTTTITVPYGTPSINLEYHFVGAVCWGSSAQTNTYIHISGASASPPGGVSGIVTSTAPGAPNPPLRLNFNPVNQVGLYRHDWRPFNYAPSGGFTTSGTYTIWLRTHPLNVDTSGTHGCAAAPGGIRNNVSEIDSCPHDEPGFQIYVNVEKRPPTGWIDGANCTLNSTNPAYATGWVWDPDAPAGTTSYVRIWSDATSPVFGGRIVGEGWADISRPDLAAYPGARGFNIDISAFKDAYRHNLFAVVTNSNGENRATLLLGSPRAGPCALPRCGTYTSTPARPEAGTPFTGQATYNYSPGSQGWAINGDMGLDINSVRRGTITFHSPAGVATWNGTPIPPGANRTNQITVNNIVIPTPGDYAVGWPMQWLINGGDNELKDVLRADPLYDWYLAGNGNTYATLRCPSETPVTPTVVSMPYIRVSGNDVQAGGGLKPSCTPTNNLATILTYARSESANQFGENWEGSGTQFAAFALGEVANFMSAAQTGPRQNSTSGPAGNSQARPVLDLTFGNYNETYAIRNFFPGANTTIFDIRKVEGYGGLSGMSSCIDNYYQAVSTGGGTPVTSPIGNRTINGAVAEYHNGDLVINGNIDFPGSWSEDTTPSYYLVVRGNIYIQGNVDRLSGVYIAQDDGTGTKGRIYTCANGTNLFAGTQLYDACRRRLTVTGAFVAKQIKFLRTIDTLNDSVPNEAAASSRGAEVFNFGPETYMATPHPSLGTGSRKVQYDFITSLPPIL